MERRTHPVASEEQSHEPAGRCTSRRAVARAGGQVVPSIWTASTCSRPIDCVRVYRISWSTGYVVCACESVKTLPHAVRSSSSALQYSCVVPLPSTATTLRTKPDAAAGCAASQTRMALTYSAVSKVRRSQFVLVVSSAGAQAEPKPAAQPFHEGSPVALAAAPEELLNSLLATAAVAKSE